MQYKLDNEFGAGKVAVSDLDSEGNKVNKITFTANGDNNFVQDGIVENSLLFIDKSKNYEKNGLNVYKLPDEQYKLSKTNIEKADYIGRVIMVTNQYE